MLCIIPWFLRVFTQHHSASPIHAFCSSLNDHLKKALTRSGQPLGDYIFGNDSKGVLEDIGHVRREVSRQIALLKDTEPEMEDDIDTSESQKLCI